MTRNTARLNLYRFMEDAWEGGLEAWCEAASLLALEGRACWMVVANQGQARWIKNKFLHSGKTLMGIRFLERQALRRELAQLLEVPMESLGRETLEFVLKSLAGHYSDPSSRSVALQASGCLQALDALHAAGWDGSEFLPRAAREFQKKLARSGFWTSELDRELKKAATVKPLYLCVAGWDARFWQEMNLLEAAVACAESADLFVPMPRNAGEGVQQVWIEALEERLGLSAVTVPSSGYSSPHEALVERLEGSYSSVEGDNLQLLVAAHEHEMLEAAQDRVMKWLDSSRAGQRFGVVVPHRSPASIRMVRRLALAGISVLDDVGEVPQGELERQVLLNILQYHRRNYDVEAFIRFLKKYHAIHTPDESLEGVLHRIHRAFDEMQTRNMRLLVKSERLKNEVPQLEELVEKLGKWPERISWDEARERWERTLLDFQLTTEILEPLWSRVEMLLGGLEFNAHDFFEYLADVLQGLHAVRAPDGGFYYARVVVTTFQNALCQQWDGLLFLESVEGVWPAHHEENPFLNDRRCAELNGRRAGRGYLLGSADRTALDQAMFLDLMENCGGPIDFIATSGEIGKAAHVTYPNEWFTRCQLESGAPVYGWNSAGYAQELRRAGLESGDAVHLNNVYAQRRSADIPFNEYFLNFDGVRMPLGRWSASELDSAVLSSATFAWKELFRSESFLQKSFLHSGSSGVGSLVHRWLKRVLHPGEGREPFVWPEDVYVRLENEMRQTQLRLEHFFEEEKVRLPFWWKSRLGKASWIAAQCLQEMESVSYPWFEMEHRAEADLKTGQGELRLKGRMDLLMMDRPEFEGAEVKIIDFKTGRQSQSVSISTLSKGEGFQFAAYCLMARQLGAQKVSVTMLHPDVTKEIFTEADEEALRVQLGRLAFMQGRLTFGQSAPLTSEYGRKEVLPMATMGIPAKILQAKQRLTFGEEE